MHLCCAFVPPLLLQNVTVCCRVVDMVHTTIVIALGVDDRSSVPCSAWDSKFFGPRD